MENVKNPYPMNHMVVSGQLCFRWSLLPTKYEPALGEICRALVNIVYTHHSEGSRDSVP